MKGQVQLLIRDASVVTMNSERGIIEKDGGIAISGGRICAVGRTTDLMARFTADEILDGRGKAVIPGLVDLHAHSVLTRGLYDDLELEPFLQSAEREGDAMTPEDSYHAGRMTYLEAIKSGTTAINELGRYKKY